MATLVIIGVDGDVKKRLSTSLSVSDNLVIEPGEMLSWRETFYGQANLPPIVEIQFGVAKAQMKSGSKNQTPFYNVEVESTNAKDLFTLISICVKKFEGEVIAIDPRPREHSLMLGIRDDFRRLLSFLYQGMQHRF